MEQQPTYDALMQQVAQLKRDLDRQRQHYEEQAVAQNLFLSLIESLPLNVFSKDREGRFILANRQYCQTIGKSAEAILGRTDHDFHPPELARKYREDDLAIMTNGEVTSLEEEHRTTTGTAMDVCVIKAPLYSHHGEVNGMLGVFWDISERKQAERALYESEQRFRELVDLLPQSIFEFALDGQILFTNQSGLKMFGYTAEDVSAGITIWDLLVPEDHARVRAEMAQTDTHKRRTPMAYTARHRDGHRFPIAAYTSFIKKDGAIVGVRGIAIDQTDIKDLEARLNMAQKMEAVGQLAGGVAHDLNNLLSPILGYAELLLEDLDDGEFTRHGVQSIHDAGMKARDLVQQLLAFARKQPLRITTVDLNQVIARFEDLLRRSIREDITIDIHLCENPTLTRADAGQVEQVLMNLYVNAWQAMPEGGDLYIDLENVQLDEHYARIKPFNVRPGRFVKLSVTDTGVGMTPETQKRIFEPFFSTKEKGMGTGLGLASAYGIIKNHSGFINCYSELGHGTTFNVYFPVCEEDYPAEEGGGEGELVEGVPGGDETILFVDDDEEIITVGRKILASLGYTVLVAGGGQSAVDLFIDQHERIDLVILDYVMPGMGGREVFDALVQIQPDVNVLLSSGYSSTDQVAALIESGCRGFIQKPYDTVKMSRTIRTILDTAPVNTAEHN